MLEPDCRQHVIVEESIPYQKHSKVYSTREQAISILLARKC